jgi:hypothetical protein
MADTPLIETTRKWVVEHYTMNHYHLENTLEWLDRLAPAASEAMRLAALTHDMERAFDGPDKPVHENMGDDDAAYYTAHSARSARIVGEFLTEQKADHDLIEAVKRLIIAHEIGGWDEANLVQAADSISFFDVNVGLFEEFIRAGRHTQEEVFAKLEFTLERIQVPAARELALPLYEAAKKRIEAMKKGDA